MKQTNIRNGVQMFVRSSSVVKVSNLYRCTSIFARLTSSYVRANLSVSSLHQNKCFERGTLHRQPTEALMSEVNRCVTSDKNVTGDHKYDHKIHSIVLIIMVILSYERKKRLDRTHIVFDIIAREYGGCHHDSLMWVTIWTPNVTRRTNTKGVRCSSDLFTLCPNFVQHNQMFIRQNRPYVLISSHMFKLLSNVRPIYMHVRTNTLGCCLDVRPTRNRVVLCSSHLHKCVQVRPIITNVGPRFVQQMISYLRW